MATTYHIRSGGRGTTNHLLCATSHNSLYIIIVLIFNGAALSAHHIWHDVCWSRLARPAQKILLKKAPASRHHPRHHQLILTCCKERGGGISGRSIWCNWCSSILFLLKIVIVLTMHLLQISARVLQLLHGYPTVAARVVDVGHHVWIPSKIIRKLDSDCSRPFSTLLFERWPCQFGSFGCLPSL